MAPSALRRSERQYTYVQNAPAQRLARELRGVTGRSLPGLHRAHAAHVGPQAAERGHVAHQIKYDGYRVQVQVRQIAVRFLTRRGHDWTTGFQALAAAASVLRRRRKLSNPQNTSLRLWISNRSVQSRSRFEPVGLYH